MAQEVQAAASAAAGVDWTTVALAAATFVGTLVTTVWGWTQGRKKFAEQVNPKQGADVPVAAGVIMDNQSIRESTVVSRELRDQLLILNHNIQQLNRGQEEICGQLIRLSRDLRERGNG